MIGEENKTNDKLEPDEEALLKIFKQNENSTLKTLVGIYKGHYLNLFLSIIFFLLKSSPVWVLPVVSANIINAATDKGTNAVHIIVINIIIILVMVLQNIPTNYVHTVLYAKTIRSVERELRSILVKKLQQLSIAYHTQMQSGRLQSKIMRDVEQIENLSSQVFITILSIVLNIVAALGVVIFKSLTVFIFFIATIPVAVLIIVAFGGKIKRYNTDYRKEMEETSVRVMEMVELIPVTRAHALEKQEAKKIENQLINVAKKGLKLDLIQAYFSSISWVAFQVFQIICLGFTGYIALKGNITIGEVVLYQTYFGSIVAQISGIITLLPTIAKGLESVASIGDILLSDDIENNRKKKKIKDVKGEITFKDVEFQYKDSNAPILKNLSFSINPGETVAFVGASGAGKSTILNLVIGFFQATCGQVLIDNQDIKSINLQSYRSHIAVVPQNAILFSDTIRENILYGIKNISDEALNKIIKAANLEELIESLPDGLDTRITEHGSNLSGGQRQRISIARAFVRNPKILVLDEATSALDSISEKKIQESIESLVKDRTTLVVAHRLSTIRNADKIAVIGNGGLEEFGTYDELMEKKGEFYKLKKLQM
ncbi:MULTISPECIES: ABC transporter ATP-binding protein [unclassified Clostridium]|uniref:ABC transporter ATP-binding protein n=1 Tax=unclassified Clostridium TaxID=2614128 RepID=UPI000297C8FA|nr:MULTISPECIES: ABC transporter ATP-binding protein [unclassified Clostridium]EKQ56489.1 MAG: ABC-type multidrug transport system, ATPase and permease component [Clostridium sp. Maddingley MBC34-26]